MIMVAIGRVIVWFFGELKVWWMSRNKEEDDDELS